MCEAFQPGHARRRDLRRKGLPAARGAQAAGRRPQYAIDAHCCADGARSGRSGSVVAQCLPLGEGARDCAGSLCDDHGGGRKNRRRDAVQRRDDGRDGAPRGGWFHESRLYRCPRRRDAQRRHRSGKTAAYSGRCVARKDAAYRQCRSRKPTLSGGSATKHIGCGGTGRGSVYKDVSKIRLSGSAVVRQAVSGALGFRRVPVGVT
ncbi:hypothetical protein HYPGJ_32041 [Hyphomicrobium sp. GJ21]|nr:hypothetical protein HYPGJ_32041 [Hyphomicrobium sp. GJ21]